MNLGNFVANKGSSGFIGLTDVAKEVFMEYIKRIRGWFHKKYINWRIWFSEFVEAVIDAREVIGMALICVIWVILAVWLDQ
ncbi:MAG: hypothetical protein WC471_03340 [Candidatus Woesearchaeota archaeon]